VPKDFAKPAAASAALRLRACGAATGSLMRRNCEPAAPRQRTGDAADLPAASLRRYKPAAGCEPAAAQLRACAAATATLRPATASLQRLDGEPATLGLRACDAVTVNQTQEMRRWEIKGEG